MATDATKTNELPVLTRAVMDTAAGWQAADYVIPAGVFTVDTTTGRVRLGNGTSLRSALPDLNVTSEQRALLDKLFTDNGDGTFTLKEGVNIPQAPIIADAEGKIRKEALPDFLFNTTKIVADIAERDALSTDFHNSPVLVIDATGDTTVAAGAALYFWYDPDGDGALPESWNKIAEYESLDIDWSVELSDHFKYKGDNANTLDDILDGTNFVKMSTDERTKLSGIEALADVTDTENVRAAGAVMCTDKILGALVDAAGLQAMITAGIVTPTL